MKLSECTLGRLVVNRNGEVGHIVGLTYNIHVMNSGELTPKERFERTIPLVKFPYGEQAIHHANLDIFE